MDSKQRLERARTLGWCIILVFAVLAGRLWYLQIAQGHKYMAMADGNRIRWLRTVAPRGRIFDRNGVPLATNRASFTVSLMPGGLSGETRMQLMTKLGELLGLTMEELEEAIAKGSRYPYEAIRVMQDVPPETVVALEERRFELPGVMVEMEEVREKCFRVLIVCGWLILGVLAVGAQDNEEIMIIIPPGLEVDGGELNLGQVAVIKGATPVTMEKLKQVYLGPAPRYAETT